MPEAEQALSKAIEIDETWDGALSQLGHVRSLLGDFTGAKSVLLRSIELQPHIVRPYVDLVYSPRRSARRTLGWSKLSPGRWDEKISPSTKKPISTTRSEKPKTISMIFLPRSPTTMRRTGSCGQSSPRSTAETIRKGSIA